MKEMTNVEQLSSINSLSFVGKTFPAELYSVCEQYLLASMQMQAEPMPISERVYHHMPERAARKILSFLDGKNITTLRYHRLLELDPQKAQFFIDGAMAHYNISLMKDSPNRRVPYGEFLTLINNAIIRLFCDALEGITFVPSISDPYKEQAAALEADELYGVLYRAVRAGDQEPLYLSAQSEDWLSYDALIEEYFSLDLPAVMEDKIVYEDGKPIGKVCTSLKPIGYGNSDKFTWILHHGNNELHSHKALFETIRQLELTDIDPATFTMLLDMGGH